MALTQQQQDLVVEVCHELINHALQNEPHVDDSLNTRFNLEYAKTLRDQEEALRAALAEIERLTVLCDETAKFIDNIKPFMVGASPTHKDRGGEADRLKLCKWLNKLRAKL